MVRFTMCFVCVMFLCLSILQSILRLCRYAHNPRQLYLPCQATSCRRSRVSNIDFLFIKVCIRDATELFSNQYLSRDENEKINTELLPPNYWDLQIMGFYQRIYE